MPLIDDVKSVLRVDGNDFDVEVTDLIDAGIDELVDAGIVREVFDAWLSAPDSDKFLKRIIMVYCKGYFGWNNPEKENYQAIFENYKEKITMSTGYSYYKVTINTSEQQIVEFDGTEKETDDAGTVIFYSRSKNHVKYVVANVDYYVDITGDTIINV